MNQRSLVTSLVTSAATFLAIACSPSTNPAAATANAGGGGSPAAAGEANVGTAGDLTSNGGAAAPVVPVPPGGVDYGPKVNAIAYQWVNAVSYSGYRDGQSQITNVGPTGDQILEDLQIVGKRWGLIRGYGTAGPTPGTLEAIRSQNLPIKVFLAASMGKDRNANDQEDEAAIALANDPKYSGIIAAVIVGNECQVSWSDHVIPTSELVEHIRRIKANVQQPVTVADNWYWWSGGDANGSSAPVVASEVDFIMSHFYPLMEEIINGAKTGVTIANAMDKTSAEYDTVQRRFPKKYVVIGEAGWATAGKMSQTIDGEPNEQNQQTYYGQLTSWAHQRHVITFWFEAFDEQWKDPSGYGLEAHWGLFTTKRQPKLAISADSQ